MKPNKEEQPSGKPKYLKFFVLFILGFVNLSVDWFFYTRIELIEPGLVYGPPEHILKTTIFSFCICATIGFFLEIIYNLDSCCNRKNRRLRFISHSLTNFISVVVTDLPILTLNLIVTACHDGNPTLISIAKSSICIIIVTVRSIFMIIHKCFSARQKTRKLWKSILDIISACSLVAVFLISIKIHLLRVFPISGYSLKINVNPLEFKTLDFMSSKYFNGVGIYAAINTLNPGMNKETSLYNNKKISGAYIWLADINEVIQETYLKLNIRTNYHDRNSNFSLCLSKSNAQIYNEECYIFDSKSQHLTHINNNQTLINGKYDSYYMIISYTPAQAYKHLLGYLDYNLKYENSTSKECTDANISSLLYAKFLPAWPEKHKSHLKNHGRPDRFFFYNKNIDLYTVDKLWRTGVINCKMSGDLGPKLNQRIQMTCS